ncbi:helix-turn-helix domain-containing protein [Terrabacter sp. Soil811]|uniref:helix-turn-helix domain-containing protein n=1 Tax=Terrabacter sp. Soil811 TaxID=1736419 RepID=UPI0009E81EA1
MSTFPNPGHRRRLSRADRERVGKVLLERYNAGASIRTLCVATGYSIGRVRKLLEDAGVEYRPKSWRPHHSK